ncbi:MAG: hypothetical protein JRJ77_09830 [Deltaproteobacteria bacterium]|nr:hypothetical protein [Deltaproteobacteria bacterium]
MDKFTKITVGFVTQTFEKDDKGQFVCTRQEFVAGDQCDYEDAQGNPIEPPEHQYQPYNMMLCTETAKMMEVTTTNKMYDAIEQVLHSLDVGGEQSRQFAEEIKTLKNALKTTPTVDDSCPKCGAGFDEREFTDKDFLDSEAIHMHYVCKKCGSQIIEEFTLTDVFIDDPQN